MLASIFIWTLRFPLLIEPGVRAGDVQVAHPLLVCTTSISCSSAHGLPSFAHLPCCPLWPWKCFLSLLLLCLHPRPARDRTPAEQHPYRPRYPHRARAMCPGLAASLQPSRGPLVSAAGGHVLLIFVAASSGREPGDRQCIQ